MIAGIILVTGLLLLASQYFESASGGWHGITLATLFNVPADHAFTGWTLADKALQFLAYDTEIWIILLFASALVYWVTDFAAEKFGVLAKSRPRSPQPQATA
jgi:hypothetical protein